MQVTETLSQGLKREYSIVVSGERPGREARRAARRLKTKVRINGFRPGKVPIEHLRRSTAVGDGRRRTGGDHHANKQIVDDNGLRLAREPKIELPADQAAIDAALEARGDLTSRSRSRCCRSSRSAIFREISLERPIATSRTPMSRPRSSGWPTSAAPIAEKPAGAKAENHDRVTVDFVGTIDGEPFEGGEGERHPGRAGLEHLHSGIRGRSSSASPPASKRTSQGRFPRPMPFARSPARPAIST